MQKILTNSIKAVDQYLEESEKMDTPWHMFKSHLAPKKCRIQSSTGSKGAIEARTNDSVTIFPRSNSYLKDHLSVHALHHAILNPPPIH